MWRKLGQHFLKNQSAIKKIVAALDLKNGDMVIEIGPGEGALTIPLIQECEKVGGKIIAIEKDRALVEILRGRLATKGNFLEIIDGDALRILPNVIKKLPGSNYKIVGNIPYYITGKLLHILGDLITNYQLPITNIVLTIQREVAERLSAQPPKMNLLAAATQIWANTEIVGYLKPEDFEPPPEVDSAIIKLTPKPGSNYPLQIANYYRLIKLIFRQPRKTVLNNLSTGLEMTKNQTLEILKKLDISGTERPQNLDLETLKKLSTLLIVN